MIDRGMPCVSTMQLGNILRAVNVQFEHAAVLKEMTKEAERAEKLEKKLKVITHGYLTREKGLKEAIQVAWTSLQVMA